MRPYVVLLIAGLLASTNVFAETQVNVVGLFSNMAVIMINGGKPKTLSVGQVIVMALNCWLLIAARQHCLSKEKPDS
jgi:hypothetical protein